MSASIVFSENPFNPLEKRVEPLDRFVTISDFLADAGIRFTRPTLCLYRGEPLLRREWPVTMIREGDVVEFVTLPAGGGGSNPLRVILMLAMAAAAAWLAPWLMTTYAMSAGMAAAITSVAMIGGSMLINAIVPPTKPNTPAAQSSQTASPTYSVSSRGNQAKIQGTIPRLYGRHIIYPDLAAQPYSEFLGNDQYLYQLFCIGLGDYDIDAIRIESTDIENYDGVETEIIHPDEPVTLFPDNVVTSIEVSGQEMLGANEIKCVGSSNISFAADTKTITTTAVKNNFEAKFNAADKITITGTTNNNGTFTVRDSDEAGTWIKVSETLVDESNTSATITLESDGWIGPFPVCQSGQQVNYIAFDFILPQGLVSIDSSDGSHDYYSLVFQAEIREIDTDGAAVGDWQLCEEVTLRMNTSTAQRKSYRYPVTLGRYEARVKRVGDKSLKDSVMNGITWSGLKGYLASKRTFGNVTLLAMRMRATNALSQAATSRINVIATSLLPAWDPLTQTWGAPAASRSIAWAFADMLRAEYGAGLPDSRLDLDGLAALDAEWTAREDYFDAVIDSKQGLWDALTQVARVGRAIPIAPAGVIGMVRDKPQTVRTAMFTGRNIVRGSLTVKYLFFTPDSPDSVLVEYYDSDTWQWEQVLCELPGMEGATSRPSTLRIVGITDRDHAWREGMYAAACNRDQRIFVRFSTELEGHIPMRGDLVSISHDMPQWGYAGEIEAYAWPVLTASIPLTWKDGAQHYVALRKRNGSVVGPYEVSPGSDEFEMVISGVSMETFEGEDQENVPDTGDDRERTHFQFGPGSAWGLDARVLAVTPRSGGQVEIYCVNASDAVHTADEGIAPLPTVKSLLPQIPDGPLMGSLCVVQLGTDAAPILRVSWPPSSGAATYILQTSPDGLTWTTVSDLATTSRDVPVSPGAVRVRVAGESGSIQGPWSTWSGTAGGAAPVPATPTGLALREVWDGETLKIQWTAAENATYYVVEVYADGLMICDIATKDTTLDIAYDFKGVSEDRAAFEVRLRAFSPAGEAADYDSLAPDNEAPPAPTGLAVTGIGTNVLTLSWTGSGVEDSKGFLLFRSQTSGFTPSGEAAGDGNCVWVGTATTRTVTGLSSGTSYYFRVAEYDSWGKTGLNYSAQVKGTTETA